MLSGNEYILISKNCLKINNRHCWQTWTKDHYEKEDDEDHRGKNAFQHALFFFFFFFKDNRMQTHDKQLLSINGRYISQNTEWEWKKMSFDYMIMAISGLELTPYSFAHFNKLSKQFLCPNIELHKRCTIFIVSTWRGVFNFSQNHVS